MYTIITIVGNLTIVFISSLSNRLFYFSVMYTLVNVVFKINVFALYNYIDEVSIPLQFMFFLHVFYYILLY